MSPTESARTVASRIRGLVRPNLVVMGLAGVLAGYSVGILGRDAVVLPVVGPVSGTLLGAAGLVVAGVAYHRTSCCDDCGQRTWRPGSDCGCGDDCGDRCAVDSK